MDSRPAGDSSSAPVSHIVLLSDGADRDGEIDADAMKKLADNGIRLLIVGTDWPNPLGPDAAVLAWNAPAMVPAGSKAVLSARIKIPIGQPTTVRLREGETVLAETMRAQDGKSVATMRLEYPAGAVGSRLLTLEVEAEGDMVPGNDRIVFRQTSVAKMPELLMIDETPDWDGVYWGLAAQRAGIPMRQAHVGDKPPERGGFGSSIPKTPEQWNRYAGVLLRGSPFPGFDDEDAETLRDWVEQGGTLVISGTSSEQWISALAPVFGWHNPGVGSAPRNRQKTDLHFSIPPYVSHLPPILAANDPEESRLRLSALPPPRHMRAVPDLDLSLIEDESRFPDRMREFRRLSLFSLGFLGRGKVILLGLDGFSPMRRFEGADWIDRLLESIVTEAATPLFAEGQPVAVYPPLPMRGRPVWFVSGDPLRRSLSGLTVNESLLPWGGNWKHYQLTMMQSVESESLSFQDLEMPDVPVADNPGMELHFPEFNPDFLRKLAAAGQGAYVDARYAPDILREIQPETWRRTETVRYHPGRHWTLLAFIAVLAALLWVSRKLAGLAI